MQKKYHELLMPAGSFEKAIYALEYGADAIYLGARSFSLRARSSNFNFDEIKKITNIAHSLNKKVYLVCNIICHNSHLNSFNDFFKEINLLNLDGFIVADPYIFQEIKKINPISEIHISTQQSICNSKAISFWKRAGASRIVLGREVSLEELKKTLKKINNSIEIEYFIHGAVCISYSGRCMMSNNFSNRDANVGGCAQSCRWNYKVENKEIDSFFTMSAKDMSLLKNMNELLKLPISSFKVEGRMKSIHYLSTIASCYSKVINNFYNKKDFIDIDLIYKELLKAENRKTSNAFFDALPNSNKMLYENEEKILNKIFIFSIEEKISKFEYKILSRNYFTKNDSIEIVMPDLKNVILKIKKIENEKKENIEIVNKPMQFFYIEFDKEIKNWKNKIGRLNK